MVSQPRGHARRGGARQTVRGGGTTLSREIEGLACDAQLAQDRLQGARGYLVLGMAGYRGAAPGLGVEPQFVASTLLVKHHAELTQSSLQLGVGHGSAIAMSTRVVPCSPS